MIAAGVLSVPGVGSFLFSGYQLQLYFSFNLEGRCKTEYGIQYPFSSLFFLLCFLLPSYFLQVPLENHVTIDSSYSLPSQRTLE